MKNTNRRPQGLRVEHEDAPANVAPDQPRFEWRVATTDRGAAQSAYRVQVARTRAASRRGVRRDCLRSLRPAPRRVARPSRRRARRTRRRSTRFPRRSSHRRRRRQRRRRERSRRASRPPAVGAGRPTDQLRDSRSATPPGRAASRPLLREVDAEPWILGYRDLPVRDGSGVGPQVLGEQVRGGEAAG